MADLVSEIADPIKVYETINTAEEFLKNSMFSFQKGDYPSSFEDSRNALRLAASALLFKNGLIGKTLEATINHIESKYPDIFPCKEWVIIEKTISGFGPGMFNILILALNKGADKEKAQFAYSTAEKFVKLVKSMV